VIAAIIAKRKVSSSFGSISRHDLDTFLADWSENATFIYPGSLSVSGEMRGKQAIKGWFQKFVEQFPVSSFTVKNVCVANPFALGGTNVVAVEWDINVKNRDGEEFQNSGVTVISLKGRKAVLVRDFTHMTKVCSS